MLLKGETLAGIADGTVTLAFRRWKRPTVKAGGTLLTPVGQLSIDSVDEVDPDDLDDRDALAAGFDDVDELRSWLQKKSKGHVYRVALRLVGPDPRVALREEVPDTPEELDRVCGRLDRWDASSPTGRWCRAALDAIATRPGVRAGDLAVSLDLETARFKTNVRKLKGIGLTESLEVGYRLSPRGEAVLDHLRRSDG